MFSFSHVYPSSLYTEGRKPRNVRTRVLGFVHPKQVLYLVMTSHQTEILLVDEDGKSQTVLAFNRYIEIICADISYDFDLLIYTERIPNGTRFSFKSVMYHIHSFSDIKAFEDNSPITSFFLPDINNNSSNIAQSNLTKKEYLFVNIIGNRIAYFRATFANKKLQIKQERLALNLTNCRSFFYNSSRNHRLICAITRNNTAYFYSFGKNRYYYHTSYKLTSYEAINFNKYDLFNLSKSNFVNSSTNKSSGGFSIFGFSKDKNKNNVKFENKESITISPETSVKLMNAYATLPPELALLPSVPSNNPFFRFSNGNMYVIRLIPLPSSNSNLKSLPDNDSIEAFSTATTTAPTSFCKDFAIIEQLYRGEEFPLAFTITIAEQSYSRLIEVPNVQPDVPINFLSYDNIVFAFVLNSFVAMIDFMVFPPSIYFLPRCLSQGPPIDSNENHISDSQKACCDISSTTGSFTVDLESGEVYQIKISMDEIPDNLHLNFHDRKLLKIFATLIARLPNCVSFSSVINKLPMNEIGTLIYFFHAIFQIGLAMELNGKSKSSSSAPSKAIKQPPKSNPVHASKIFRQDNLINTSLSSSSSASGGGISLTSFDDASLVKNYNTPNQSQNQNFTYNRNYNHNSSKPRIKHYGRTVHDLGDMHPPLSKEQLSMLEEMSKEFPSHGKYTRVDSFLYLLYQFRSLNVREREAPDVAMHHLHSQNKLSHLIRAGLDEWEKLYKPNEATKFILNAVVINEAIKSSAPLISCLELEVAAMADSICPQTIRNHLRCSAKLFGISGDRLDIVDHKKKKRHGRNSTVSMNLKSLYSSSNSLNQSLSPRSGSILRRKTLTGSVTVFSSSRPIRGKRNSLTSFPSNIQSKLIKIKKGNSSSNFFRQLKFIESKNKEKKQNTINSIPKSFDPEVFCKVLMTREEVELRYWSNRLPSEFREIFGGSKNGSDSEINSIVLSKLTESQWSRADTTFSSDCID